MRYTLKSRVGEVYRNPIGHDVISKILLQMNLGDFLITNPVVANLKLGTLKKLARKKLGEGFFDTLLNLLSSAEEMPAPTEAPQEKWWKEAVFYQIYPRSFCDTNGDGVGDLRGIIGKLDYLKNLGIDAVWLSPIYDSPNDDNGYDIRDYEKIQEEFGTMADFDELVTGLHNRGMKLIMDLVINHTSDEHKWFKEALTDENSPYRDYYYFKSGNAETPPNNWTSFFSGSAWNYYEAQKLWALHLFSKKQMDLNWENPAMREEVYIMIRNWLARGVDGFRLDVINYISKRETLPDGDEAIGTLMGFTGVEHYFYGPRLHEFLRELHSEAFAPYSAFSVGETPGVGIEMCKQLTRQDRGELDMVFSFDHLETPGKTRFDDYAYDLNYLKRYLIDWAENYGDLCWQSLFYENHDNPRMPSKVDPTGRHTTEISKLLAVLQLTLRGTPFIFQGQERGAVNVDFKSINELRDVESLNLYKELLESGMDEAAAFKRILAGTRDHARVLMGWERPEAESEASVLAFFKALIALRRESPALVYGKTRFVHKKRKNYFAYTRELNGEAFFVECNLSAATLKAKNGQTGALVLSNYDGNSAYLHPYETRIFRVV